VPAETLTPALEVFPARFQAALVDAIFARLGIRCREPARDAALLLALETALAAKTVEIDRFFFDWRGGRRRGPSPADAAYGAEAFVALERELKEYEPVTGALAHEHWSDEGPCSMHIEEVEAIWSRIDEADDWGPFHAKIAAVRRMGEALAPPA
jgi:uncharacterized protein YdiU (UPF0061 family)